MKCKNCGYEIEISEAWGRIEPYHTGKEENMLANRSCDMVHGNKEVNHITFHAKAELTDEDKLRLLKSIFSSGGETE